jgi:SAM-dependent methyltransferase
MTTTTTGASSYVLGHSASEQRRLDAQGAQLRGFTERLLRDAGISCGMRVLDIGCGTGDVSLLAADLVGPTGTVVGIDRSPDVLDTARGRARASGCADRVHYIQQDLTTIGVEFGRFDAIVGRNVLMHQPDPVGAVKRLIVLLQPGGVLAIGEPVLLATPLVGGTAQPLASRCMSWLCAAFQGAGLQINVGLQLYSIFRAAGLQGPAVRIDGAAWAGPDVAALAWLAETVRSMLPLIERFGIARAADLDIETLLDRLVAEADAAGGMLCGYLQGAAWARHPLGGATHA